MTGIDGDERRVRQLLRDRGVSYAPQDPPAPAGWWDELYDSEHDDHHRPPDGPPPPAPRLGNWRKGEAVDLRGNRPEPPDDAAPEPTTTKPDADGEQLLDDDTEGQWEDVDEPAKPPAHAARRTPASQRAQQAYAELPDRARAALYTGTAAAAGYWIGLAPLMEGWITDCGHANTPTAAVVLGLGLVVAAGVLIDRRTRGWWGPLPWLCRIPLASAVLALLLYAPGVTS